MIKKRFIAWMLIFILSVSTCAFASDITVKYDYKGTITAIEGETFTLPVSLYCTGGTFTTGYLSAYSTDKSVVTAVGSLTVENKSGGSFTASCKAISAGEARVLTGFTGSVRTSGKYTVTETEYIIKVLSPEFYATLDPNGGTCSVTGIQVHYYQPYGYYCNSLPVPTRDGYKFDGWYTSAAGGNPVTATTVFTEKNNVTLYAHWSPVSYVVYFDPNGGETPVEYKYVQYGDTYGELPVPVYEGYEFKGWYTDIKYGVDVTKDTVVNFTDEQVLYAHWKSIAATPSPSPAPTLSKPDKISAEVVLTDNDGNNISSASEISGKVTANVVVDDVQLGEEEETRVNVALAVYGRNGALISISTMEVDIAGINHVFAHTIEIPENVEVGSIKMMIWNNLSEMSPLAAASSLI